MEPAVKRKMPSEFLIRKAGCVVDILLGIVDSPLSLDVLSDWPCPSIWSISVIFCYFSALSLRLANFSPEWSQQFPPFGLFPIFLCIPSPLCQGLMAFGKRGGGGLSFQPRLGQITINRQKQNGPIYNSAFTSTNSSTGLLLNLIFHYLNSISLLFSQPQNTSNFFIFFNLKFDFIFTNLPNLIRRQMSQTKMLSIAVVLVLFISSQFGCFARDKTNKHNLFFSTFPAHKTEYLYNFKGLSSVFLEVVGTNRTATNFFIN